MLTSSLLFPQWSFKKDIEWYKNGPEKGWSKRDHEKYNNWREDIFVKRFTDEEDPQLLRIQKAILNGNKITTRFGTMDQYLALETESQILFGRTRIWI